MDDKIENNEKLVDKMHELAMHYYQDLFGNCNDSIALSDIAEVVMGQAPDGSSYNEAADGIPFYQGRTDFRTLFPSERLFTTAPTRFAKQGDVLFSVRAPVGDVNVANADCCIGRGLAAIRNKLGFENNAAIYYALIAAYSDFDIYNGSGTVFGCINKTDLNTAKLKVGSFANLKEFNFKVSALFDKCIFAIHENKKLLNLKKIYLQKFFD